MEFGRNLCRGYRIKLCEGGGLVGDVVLIDMNIRYGELMVVRLIGLRLGKVFWGSW